MCWGWGWVGGVRKCNNNPGKNNVGKKSSSSSQKYVKDKIDKILWLIEHGYGDRNEEKEEVTVSPTSFLSWINQVGKVGVEVGGWCESHCLGKINEMAGTHPFRCAWSGQGGQGVIPLGEWQQAWVDTRNTQILESKWIPMLTTRTARVFILAPRMLSFYH